MILTIMKKPPHQLINQQAAEWAAKADSGTMTAAEHAEFNAWLEADPRHLGAYAKAVAVLAQLERAGAAGACRLRPPGFLRAVMTRRRVVLSGSVAAGAGFAVIAGRVIRNYFQNSYSTRVGETEVVPLSDGSVITLNTNSKVSVNYSRSVREISLLKGEILCDVAKNKTRPFIVMAGDTQVQALGTSFSVKRLPDLPVQVLVQEGTVEVKRPDNPQVAPVTVSINSKVVAPQDAPMRTVAVAPNQVTRDLAWRVGRIAFDNQTLADAAREFARYSDIRIAVDPDVADQTITGLFVSNDPVGFARAAAASLGLHAEIANQDEVRITR